MVDVTSLETGRVDKAVSVARRIASDESVTPLAFIDDEFTHGVSRDKIQVREEGCQHSLLLVARG